MQLKRLSINHLIPNLVTLASLCAGLSAIRFALLERWEHAIIAVMISAICDTLDGRLARMLKGTSQFGAELDSLADLVAFGVAPALIIYLWSLQCRWPFGLASGFGLPLLRGLAFSSLQHSCGRPQPAPFYLGVFYRCANTGGRGLVFAAHCVVYRHEGKSVWQPQ
jgi:CDP-diacylglycerol--serine O-phosphatidyltransferase